MSALKIVQGYAALHLREQDKGLSVEIAKLVMRMAAMDTGG